ncbi:cancer-related nucleoside-triphosphatase [Diaphorina citri]|uniref:Cancer-related nucleoside-triphosphatase n=1 Tax=Diaphorina citri TaxID=121845 RepID=A0A1S3DMZ9_DIACI|nr:cancer-related nucleoside-triphosphatase [Diaphorina citri]
MSGAGSKLNIILLTGDPGCGKTTLVHKAYQSLLSSGVKMEGFYTEEVRAGSQRSGFDVVLLNGGQRGPLARVTSTVAGPKVGKYTVDLKSFESLVLPILSPERLNSCQVLILDEIGKMELFSKPFESAVHKVFQSPQVILATVPTRGSSLVEKLKFQAGPNLIRVHPGNRDTLVEEIKKKLMLQIKT